MLAKSIPCRGAACTKRILIGSLEACRVFWVLSGRLMIRRRLLLGRRERRGGDSNRRPRRICISCRVCRGRWQVVQLVFWRATSHQKQSFKPGKSPKRGRVGKAIVSEDVMTIETSS